MTTAAPNNIPAPPPGCPFNAEFLPPNLRKHVDPAAPVPLRMMAAKALVPLAPSDMLGALFMLTFDADAGVRETAAKTAAALPDRFSAGLRDEGVAAPEDAQQSDVDVGRELDDHLIGIGVDRNDGDAVEILE